MEAVENSPNSTRNILRRQKVTKAKHKLTKVVTNLENAFAATYDVSTSQISLTEAGKTNQNEIVVTKSENFEVLMNEFKAKSTSPSNDRLVQLLMLKPQSWSID